MEDVILIHLAISLLYMLHLFWELYISCYEKRENNIRYDYVAEFWFFIGDPTVLMV